ncbi:MAG: multidrug effflux MFS transporter [Desulfobacteraceae bacterium]|nr:multidrug effflux MFS transporter [Desulfobacteraceae bacterium]
MSYRQILLLLALLTAFPPVSTDMYLPALPMLQAAWGTDLATINLTLVLFFVFFSISLLAYGPVSDSYGRRPLLLFGIALYVLASFTCGAASGVKSLIGSRILQAIGAASASALSLAIAKDLFQARERQQLLAHVGVIVALAPMLAPVAGSWVLKGLSWRWIFFIQAAWGIWAWFGVLRMAEPLREKVPAAFFQIVGRYLKLFRNRRFMILNALMALSTAPVFAFIAGSPAIYISHFHLDAQQFGLFFGGNATGIMIGAFTCSRWTRRRAGWPMMLAGFGGIALGGLSMGMIGPKGPLPFAVSMFLVTFCIGMTRPLSNNLVLEQVSQDVGTASSLLIFLYFLVGAGAMAMISLPWAERIGVIAWLAAGSGLVMLGALLWIAGRWQGALKAVQ